MSEEGSISRHLMRILVAEAELKQAGLEERDRYLFYLEAQQKKYAAESKVREARQGE